MDLSKLGLTPVQHVERCPCCARAQLRLFECFPHFGVPLRYRICRYCGLVFLSPRFSAAQLAGFYATTYREVITTTESDDKHLREHQRRAAHLTTFLRAHRGSVRTHLDIGCSTGALLSEVRERFGCRLSVGVEPTHRYRARAAANFHVVDHLEKVGPPDGGFELVTLSHVLEHLTDPLEYLRLLHRDYMAPHGHLLIEVPNLMGHSSFEISHQYCFYTKTLRNLLGRAGFEVVAMKVHSIPRSVSGGRHYISAVAVRRAAGAALPRIGYVPWWVVKALRIKAMDQRSWLALAVRAVRRAPQLLWPSMTDR